MPPIVNLATILLVEDDESVRRMARTILGDCGYDVIEAGDGAQALEIACSHEGPIHVLLTDIIMPNLNGLLLAERLCEQRVETAVIFMSGYVEGSIVSEKRPGATFVSKPFTPTRLIDAVNFMVKTRNADLEETSSLDTQGFRAVERTSA
jgi:DNA-binding NtrC family response regulator